MLVGAFHVYSAEIVKRDTEFFCQLTEFPFFNPFDLLFNLVERVEIHW